MFRYCLAGFVIIIALCAASLSQQSASKSALPSHENQFAVLKGMPYSATRTITITRTEADGKTSTQTLISLLWRDIDGRTRQDDISESQMGESRAVNVSDPVSRVGYAWNDGDNLDKRANAVIVTHTPASMQEVDIWPDSAAADRPRVPASGHQIRPANPNLKFEILPRRILNGIYVEGQRITRTAPATGEGNGKSTTETDEKWYSPELKITIYSVRDDPRDGKTVTELTNIDRSNPEPSLFKPPTDRPMSELTLRPRPN